MESLPDTSYSSLPSTSTPDHIEYRHKIQRKHIQKRQSKAYRLIDKLRIQESKLSKQLNKYRKS